MRTDIDDANEPIRKLRNMQVKTNTLSGNTTVYICWFKETLLFTGLIGIVKNASLCL